MTAYNETTRTLEDDKVHFAVIGIEATAERMKISPEELIGRLNKVGLIDRFIFGCYETLHTESVDALSQNIENALLTWEAKGGSL